MSSLVIFYLNDQREPIVGIAAKPHTPDFYRIFDAGFTRPKHPRIFSAEDELIRKIETQEDFISQSEILSDEHGVRMYESNEQIKAWFEWRTEYNPKIIPQSWRAPVFTKHVTTLDDLLARWERNIGSKLTDDKTIIYHDGPIWIHQFPREINLGNYKIKWVKLSQLFDSSHQLDNRFIPHYKRFKRWIRKHLAEEKLFNQINNSPPTTPPTDDYADQNPFAILDNV